MAVLHMFSMGDIIFLLRTCPTEIYKIEMIKLGLRELYVIEPNVTSIFFLNLLLRYGYCKKIMSVCMFVLKKVK